MAVAKKPSSKALEINSKVKFSDAPGELKVKALLVGRAKTGKTTFAGTFPKPFFINTDKGMVSLKGKNIPYITIERMTEENKKNPDYLTRWLDVRQILVDLKMQEGEYWEGLASYKPETIVLDSISALSDLMEAEIICDPPDKKDRSDTLFLSDYNIIQRRMFSLIDLLRELPYHVIATSGIDVSQDELGRMLENPSATGNKLGPKIPHFFDEVYYHEYDKDNKVWTLTPVQSKRFPHGGSRVGLEMKTYNNPSFDMFKKFYK